MKSNSRISFDEGIVSSEERASRFQSKMSKARSFSRQKSKEDTSESETASPEASRSRSKRLSRRRFHIQLDNQLYYFLTHHKVCPADVDSRYDAVTNRTNLIRKNGRQLINGVMIG